MSNLLKIFKYLHSQTNTQTNQPMKTKLVFLISVFILATSLNVSADPHKKKRKKSKYRTTACSFGKKCKL